MSKSVFNTRDNFDLAVSIGAVEGIENAQAFALGINLASGVPVILGTGTATPLLPPDTGTTVEIFNADAGNIGAEITIMVLDLNFERRTITVPIVASGVGAEVIDPNTGSPLVITRVNGAVNRGERATGTMVADMDIRDISTPANVFGVIDAASQELQQAIFTVPRGYLWSALSLVGSMQKSGGTDTDVSLTFIAGGVGKVLRRPFSFGLQRSGNTTIDFKNLGVLAAPGPTDLMLEAVPSSAGADISARLTIRLIKE